MTYIPSRDKTSASLPTAMIFDGRTSHTTIGRLPAEGKHDHGGPIVVQGQDTDGNPRGKGGDVVLQGGIGPSGAGAIICRSGRLSTLPMGTLIAFPIFSGKQEVSDHEWVELGAVCIDKLALPSARAVVTFEAILCTSSAMVSAEVELRNVTAGETVLAVETRNTTPAAVGGAVTLAHGKGVYMVRVRSGEGGQDAASAVTCYGSMIYVQYK